jgi:hypothetical protein
MTRDTLDAGVDACIAAVEHLMEECVEQEEAAAAVCDEAISIRHKAHRVAYYDVLTALEEIRRGDDGCKIRFRGTRAERLQIYLLDAAEHYLRRGDNLVMAGILPKDFTIYDTAEELALASLLGFIAWLREQVAKDANARDHQLER